jgi:hypothetical protein
MAENQRRRKSGNMHVTKFYDEASENWMYENYGRKTAEDNLINNKNFSEFGAFNTKRGRIEVAISSDGYAIAGIGIISYIAKWGDIDPKFEGLGDFVIVAQGRYTYEQIKEIAYARCNNCDDNK